MLPNRRRAARCSGGERAATSSAGTPMDDRGEDAATAPARRLNDGARALAATTRAIRISSGKTSHGLRAPPPIAPRCARSASARQARLVLGTAIRRPAASTGALGAKWECGASPTISSWTTAAVPRRPWRQLRRLADDGALSAARRRHRPPAPGAWAAWLTTLQRLQARLRVIRWLTSAESQAHDNRDVGRRRRARNAEPVQAAVTARARASRRSAPARHPLALPIMSSVCFQAGSQT